MLTLILSLLYIIVGHTEHNCWVDTGIFVDRSCEHYNKQYKLLLRYYTYIHTYLHYVKIHVMNVMRENHITQLIISFNISKARFYILLFHSVSVEGFILYCGAMQALISLYIQLFKRNDQEGN